MQEHLEFIKAMQARDEAAALALMTQHLDASRQRVLARATGSQEGTGAALRRA